MDRIVLIIAVALGICGSIMLVAFELGGSHGPVAPTQYILASVPIVVLLIATPIAIISARKGTTGIAAALFLAAPVISFQASLLVYWLLVFMEASH